MLEDEWYPSASNTVAFDDAAATGYLPTHANINVTPSISLSISLTYLFTQIHACLHTCLYIFTCIDIHMDVYTYMYKLSKYIYVSMYEHHICRVVT